jgi:hypothetical protein
MKNLKLTVLGLVLATSGLLAQEADLDMSDKWVTKDVVTMEIDSDEYDVDEITMLEITEVFTPVMLDPEDRYKLNQDIIFMPTQISKTIKLDYDADALYDREVEFTYNKSDDFDLDFTLTKDGIIILTDKDDLFVKRMWDKNSEVMFSNIKNKRIKNEGDYVIELTDGQKVDLKISNYEKM